jgi:hypothetical protein
LSIFEPFVLSTPSTVARAVPILTPVAVGRLSVVPWFIPLNFLPADYITEEKFPPDDTMQLEAIVCDKCGAVIGGIAPLDHHQAWKVLEKLDITP